MVESFPSPGIDPPSPTLSSRLGELAAYLAAPATGRLTDEQRAAVEKHSGMAIALLAGFAWTNADIQADSNLAAQGVEFLTLSDEDLTQAREILLPLETEWLEQAKSKVFEGEAILEYALGMVEDYSVYMSGTAAE